MTDRSAPYYDGWRAHKGDVDVNENPYDERSQAFSEGEWSAGWCNRYDAIKHAFMARAVGDDETLQEIEGDY